MDELLSQDEINALLSGGSLEDGGDASLSMEDSQVLDEVASVFTSAESSVLGMLAGKNVSARSHDAEVMPQSDFVASLAAQPFVFRATFGGFEDIPLVLVLDQEGALMLADLMMGGEGKELPAEASDLYLNASQEGVSQVVGAAFTNLSGLLGGRRLMPENISSTLESEDWLPFPSFEGDAKVWSSTVDVEIEGLNPFRMRTVLPLDGSLKIAALIREIVGEQTPKSAVPPPASKPGAAPRPTAPSAPATPPPPPAGTRGAQQPAPLVDVHPVEFMPLAPQATDSSQSRIDMIADIPVRVTVELGKTRKNVSDILNMTTGSVIELDKMAGEPVDILVNGKPIAKGEVVVIDENFGVRITEVLGAGSKVYAV
ncbi:MAG: flagellar motor switch protein FliN [Fretibacterium sp.]|nr:flagellar motor switch protein FliN [Fretibacterium sp.]